MKSKTEYRVLITFADGRKRRHIRPTLAKAHSSAAYTRSGIAGTNTKWSPASYWDDAIVEVQSRVIGPWETFKGEAE